MDIDDEKLVQLFMEEKSTIVVLRRLQLLILTSLLRVR
jgi:hypothetical protein